MWTTRATLTQVSESLLGRMFDENTHFGTPCHTDEDGYFFLDADPEAFRVVLNFLRRGRFVEGKDLAPVVRKKVAAEADFFGLTALVQACAKTEAEMAAERLRENEEKEATQGAIESIHATLCEINRTLEGQIDTLDGHLTHQSGKFDCLEEIQVSVQEMANSLAGLNEMHGSES